MAIELKVKRREEENKVKEIWKTTWTNKAIEEYRKWLKKGGEAKSSKLRIKVGNAIQTKKAKGVKRK